MGLWEHPKSLMSVEAQRGQRDQGFRLRSEAERARAFVTAERHSQIVRVLRLVLPLLALVITAAYFISSGLSLRVGDLTASISGVQVNGGNLRMTNPKLQGVDKQNGSYVITADYADQNVKTPKLIKLHAIRAEIDSGGGGWSRMTATRGTFDSGNEILVMDDDIRIATNSGLTGKMTYATVNMKQQLVHSTKPVFFKMSDDSTVRSDRFTLHTRDHVLVFAGHVHVFLKQTKKLNTAAAGSASAPDTLAAANLAAPIAAGARVGMAPAGVKAGSAQGETR
jgi:lipopolysaccharide export system protein LptC